VFVFASVTCRVVLVKRLDHECSNRAKSSVSSSQLDKDKSNGVPKRRTNRKSISNELNSSLDDSPMNQRRHSLDNADRLVSISADTAGFHRHRLSLCIRQFIDLDAAARPATSSSSSSVPGWPSNRLFLSLCLITYDCALCKSRHAVAPSCFVSVRMFVLLTVNIFLCIKLNQIDRMADRLVQNHPLRSSKYSYVRRSFVRSFVGHGR
jgi:hypothetical protein